VRVSPALAASQRGGVLAQDVSAIESGINITLAAKAKIEAAEVISLLGERNVLIGLMPEIVTNVAIKLPKKPISPLLRYKSGMIFSSHFSFPNY